MENKDYGEIFCQAAEILAQQLINKVSYDRTITCTIVDDREKALGKYRVTNGEAVFDAYTSDTTLGKNNSVYVQIPNGDWNEQKIILSKKLEDINQAMTYKDPFNSFVNITNNLIGAEINQQGLIANDTNKHQILLWAYNRENSDALVKSSGEKLGGYTRLAISASFQTLLRQLGVVKGEYGLKLIIETEPEDVESNNENNENNIKVCTLNCFDMIGNFYNYESFYNQKKLFDISDLKYIKSMELWFYQKEGSFFNNKDELIPYKGKLSNIFVKDVNIALGYDANSFEDDTLILYSMDSQKYNLGKVSPEEHKKLQFRWIHRFDNDNIKQVQLSDNIDYELYWYRYQRGASSHTSWSGVDWIPLSSQISSNGEIQYDILDPDWIEYNNNSIKVTNTPIRNIDYNQSWLLPNANRNEEKIKAILTCNGERFYSNILIFSNVNEVINESTIQAFQALTINCEDNSFGNYFIYNLDGEILDNAEKNKTKEFKAYFGISLDNNNPAALTEANSIEWIIPTKNTMIEIDNFISGNEDYNYIDPDGYQHIFRFGEGTLDIETDENGKRINLNVDGPIQNQNSQRYRISNHYSAEKNNNTIRCIVTKNGIKYIAVKELIFGYFGTSGTDYTFKINFENNNNTGLALTKSYNGETPPAFIVKARLYDYTGKEISGLEYKDIQWTFLDALEEDSSKNNFMEIIPIKEKDEQNEDYTVQNKVELKLFNTDEEEVPNNNYTILKATLLGKRENGWGDFDLCAYLPIPIKISDKYRFISGATTIFYNSLGQLDSESYFQNPYEIYYIEQEDENADIKLDSANGEWEIYSGVENDPYIPVLVKNSKNEYAIYPKPIYAEGSMNQLCLVCSIEGKRVWSQPLLVNQNKYPSSIINKWNGELTINNADNVILAAKVAAGKKNNDNTFSGVIMGDWKGNDTSNAEDSITDNTGIYGFQHGITSFGFRDDGTAFIGKPGKGRIEINEEDNSTIQSSSFRHNLGGMLIDFDDALIKMYEPNKEHNIKKSIIFDAGKKYTPFTIGTKFEVDWDGTLRAKNGEFTGYIEADEGVLGDLTLNGDLEASGGTILGADIIGGTIFGSDIYFGTSEGYLYQAYEVIYSPDGNHQQGSYIGPKVYTSKLEFDSEYPIKNNCWLVYDKKVEASEIGHLGSSMGSDGTEGTNTALLELRVKNDLIPLILAAEQRVLMISDDDLVGMSAGPSWNNGLINIDSDGAIYIRSDRNHDGTQDVTGGIVNIISSEKINIGSSSESMGSISKNITITAEELNVEVDAENQYGIYARFA